MEATLQALAGLLLKSTFTVIVLVLLHIYLRVVFFGPLNRILKRRYEMTAGARAAAETSMKQAADRLAEHEEKLHEARVGVLQEQEEARRKWLADQAAQIQAARDTAGERIQRTRQEIHEETEKAQWELARQSESLAEEIADVVLGR